MEIDLHQRIYHIRSCGDICVKKEIKEKTNIYLHHMCKCACVCRHKNKNKKIKSIKIRNACVCVCMRMLPRQ